MSGIAPFHPTVGARRVLERSAEIAHEHGGHVTVTDLARAVLESFALGGDFGLSLLHQLGRTNDQLDRLIHQLQEAVQQMTTIAEAVQQFSAQADQAHADSQAERDTTDRAIKAMQDLEAALGSANLSPGQEQQVAAALAELGQSHTELAQRVSELGAAADTAEGDVNPQPAPAPQG